MCEGRRKEEEMRLKAQVAWSAVCRLSRNLTNGFYGESVETAAADHAYLSPDSFGGRNVALLHGGDWRGSALAHRVGDESPDVWLGFAERDVLELVWISASSKAEIHARQTGEGWSLEFVSSPDEDRDLESWYLVHFLGVARKGSIRVAESGDERVRARAVRTLDEENLPEWVDRDVAAGLRSVLQA
jgi:hypothetical protein